MSVSAALGVRRVSDAIIENLIWVSSAQSDTTGCLPKSQLG
jgi:hypothetical protein